MVVLHKYTEKPIPLNIIFEKSLIKTSVVASTEDLLYLLSRPDYYYFGPHKVKAYLII